MAVWALKSEHAAVTLMAEGNCGHLRPTSARGRVSLGELKGDEAEPHVI